MARIAPVAGRLLRRVQRPTVNDGHHAGGRVTFRFRCANPIKSPSPGHQDLRFMRTAHCLAWLTCLQLLVLPTAQSRPAVVELFTSQGCSSCPPAEALLRQLGQRPDIVALAFHVDYWDG